MTREELEAKLDKKLTAEEADLEWLDWMHESEVWNEY